MKRPWPKLLPGEFWLQLRTVLWNGRNANPPVLEMVKVS